MEGRRTFHTLNGLRGLAAIAVAEEHFMTRWPKLSGHGSAELMVDLFFMLSGIVVAYAYEDKLRNGMKLKEFVEIRLLRLWPLYIFGCAIYMMFAVADAYVGGQVWKLKEPLLTLPWTIFVLPRPFVDESHTFLVNPPAWSLFFEILANIVWALVLPIATARRIAIIAAVSAAGLVASAIYYQGNAFGVGGISMFPGLFRISYAFPVGLLIYKSWKSSRLPGWRVHPIACFGALALISFFDLGGKLYPVGLLVVLFGFPLLLIVSVNSEARGRTARVFDFLGLVSFPLYATHIPLLLGVREAGISAGWSDAWQDAVAAFVAVVVAVLATPLVDRPLRALLSNILQLRKREIVAAPPL